MKSNPSTIFKPTKLDQVAVFKNGKSAPERKDDYPYEVYGSNGIIGKSKDYNSDEETIIVGRVGSYCGSVYLSLNKCWVTDNAIIGRAKQGNDPTFLYYLLKHLQLNTHRGGSGQPLLNQEILNSLIALIPPFEIQQEIGKLLFALDSKIELNQQVNRTLEAIGQALFKHWFTDFEFPDKDGKPYKSSSGEMVDSELGEIPKGWNVGKLGDVVSINERSISKNYPHEVVQYIDISSVTEGRLDGVSLHELKHAPSRAKRLVQSGDTIWSCVRPNRKSYLYIHQPPDNLVVSTGFVVLTPKKIPPSYLYSWVTTDQFVDYLSMNADGSAYPAVRPEHFNMATIVIPSESILSDFENVAAGLRKRFCENEKESRILGTIRDSLLPKLLSGRIRVGVAK
jgi:type I restriction enzyme S subunit